MNILYTRCAEHILLKKNGFVLNKRNVSSKMRNTKKLGQNLNTHKKVGKISWKGNSFLWSKLRLVLYKIFWKSFTIKHTNAKLECDFYLCQNNNILLNYCPFFLFSGGTGFDSRPHPC
jgi:hypothetical protein